MSPIPPFLGLAQEDSDSWVADNPHSKCFFHWEDPSSLESALLRGMATLTISQVCWVDVGQEEKPTPKPMWLTCKYWTLGALYTSPRGTNFSRTIRFGRETELRKSKRKRGGARTWRNVSAYRCSKIVFGTLGMRWIQCQCTCMTLVICGLIWQMWVTVSAYGQVNCPRSLLLDIPALCSGYFCSFYVPNVLLPTATALLPQCACTALTLIIRFLK